MAKNIIKRLSALLLVAVAAATSTGFSDRNKLNGIWNASLTGESYREIRFSGNRFSVSCNTLLSGSWILGGGTASGTGTYSVDGGRIEFVVHHANGKKDVHAYMLTRDGNAIGLDGMNGGGTFYRQ